MTIQKTASGALFVSSKTKRVLLNLRAPHKTHKHEWSLFGGMVDGDETPKEALDRECIEEMGFLPDVTKTYPFDISLDGIYIPIPAIFETVLIFHSLYKN